jgi:hypothetical protein
MGAHTLRRLGGLGAAALASAFTLAGAACHKLPSVRVDLPFGRSDWIELRDARVVSSPSPAIGVTLVNPRDEALSVRVVIDALEGADDCENSLRLAPDQSVAYACPQRAVAAGRRFRAEIDVFRDLGQTRVVERIRRRIEIVETPSGELTLVGRALE